MLLPGRVPGYKDSDVKLLPSSTTKARHMGALPAGGSHQLDEGSGVLNIYPALASASPIHCGDEAHERLMLGMPKRIALPSHSAANRPEEEKTTVSTCTYRNILYSRKILPLSPVKF